MFFIKIMILKNKNYDNNMSIPRNRNQALAVVVNELVQRRGRSNVETVGRLRTVHRPTRNSTNADLLRETHRRVTVSGLANRLYLMCIEAVSRGITTAYDLRDRSGNARYLEIHPTFHMMVDNDLNNNARSGLLVHIGTLTVFVSDGPDRARAGHMVHTRILIDDPTARAIQNEELRWSRASSRRARSNRANISLSNDLFTTDILNHIRFQARAQRLTLSMTFTPTPPLGVVRNFLN